MLLALICAYLLGVGSGMLFMRSKAGRLRELYAEWETGLREAESWLDTRKSVLPAVRFGTPAVESDEDGMRLPVQYGTRDEHHRRLASVRDMWIRDTWGDIWEERPVDRGWRKRARNTEHESVAVKLDRLVSGPRLGRALAYVDQLGDWLATHERSWITELPPAPVGRHRVAEQASTSELPATAKLAAPSRVVRWVEPDQDDTPTLLRYDFDTAAWAVLDEWQSEGLQPVGAP